MNELDRIHHAHTITTIPSFAKQQEDARKAQNIYLNLSGLQTPAVTHSEEDTTTSIDSSEEGTGSPSLGLSAVPTTTATYSEDATVTGTESNRTDTQRQASATRRYSSYSEQLKDAQITNKTWDDTLDTLLEVLKSDEEQGKLERDSAIEMRKRFLFLQSERFKDFLQVIEDNKKGTLIETLGTAASALSICVGVATLNSLMGAVVLSIAVGSFVDRVFLKDAIADRIATWWLTKKDEHGRTPEVTLSEKEKAKRYLRIGVGFLSLLGSAGLSYSAKSAGLLAFMGASAQSKFFSVAQTWEPLLSGSLKAAELNHSIRSRTHQAALEETTKQQEEASEERNNHFEHLCQHYEAAHNLLEQIPKEEEYRHSGVVSMLR